VLFRYGTLQFGFYDEIRDVGYYHGKTYLSGMARAGLMKNFLGGRHISGSNSHNRQPFYNLSRAIRRRSVENLSVGSAGSAGSLGTPQHVAMVLGQRFATSSSQHHHRIGRVRGSSVMSDPSTPSRSLASRQEFKDAEEDDFEEDSDKLITTEDEDEDDGESGFLSQI